MLGRVHHSRGSCGPLGPKGWCLEHVQDPVAIEVLLGVSCLSDTMVSLQSPFGPVFPFSPAVLGQHLALLVAVGMDRALPLSV